MPAFLTEAFTKQYPSQEEAVASERLLHHRALLHIRHCPDIVPARVGNSCRTNAVSKRTMKRSIPFLPPPALTLASQKRFSRVPSAQGCYREAQTPL